MSWVSAFDSLEQIYFLSFMNWELRLVGLWVHTHFIPNLHARQTAIKSNCALMLNMVLFPVHGNLVGFGDRSVISHSSMFDRAEQYSFPLLGLAAKLDPRCR